MDVRSARFDDVGFVSPAGDILPYHAAPLAVMLAPVSLGPLAYIDVAVFLVLTKPAADVITLRAGCVLMRHSKSLL
jgi:hypothetical protein